MSKTRRTSQTDGLEEDGNTAGPDLADLARGANGLGADADPEEAMRDMMQAQLDMMNSVAHASMNMATSSMRAMASFWGMAAPKAGRDKDND